MTGPDVQPPEFVINRIGADGKVRKVPFLYQREGETWNQFCARMSRVSDGLNDNLPEPEETLTRPRLIFWCLIGLLIWLAIWVVVR